MFSGVLSLLPSLFLETQVSFDGERAFTILQDLSEKGERYYSAPNRHLAIENMKSHFQCPNWITQRFEVTEPISGHIYTLQNHICRFQTENEQRVLLGTHYDTRMWAEESPFLEKQNQPIMGANDGSSGVAVLAELSHLLTSTQLNLGVDIILFDGEEFEYT